MASRAAQPGEVRADTDNSLLKAGVAEWLEARAYTGLPRTTVFCMAFHNE